MTSNTPKPPNKDAVKKLTEFRKSLRNQPLPEDFRKALRNGKKKELENPDKKVAIQSPSSTSDVEL